MDRLLKNGRQLMPQLSIKRILASRLAFCAAMALLMVLFRLVAFDYAVFFGLQYVPNHDIYQGAPFFATGVHSVRLTGEIAWWNAFSNNGYAQYYQSFFSPLAPTSHHIVFILWAQMIRVLSLLKIELPEYFQYLTITYILFPFLAFLSFSLFTSFIFRRRAAIFLALVVYALSGIGLWNSAWFFFQEPFTLFLLLAALLAALQRPTLRRFLLLLTALLIQLTSINYWTVYNSWFVAITAGAYWWAYPNRVKRFFVRARAVTVRHKRGALVVAALTAVALVLWFAVMASILREQSGRYVSAFTGPEGVYSTTDAFDRVKEMRRFTTELFNPEVRRALQSYKIENEMHNARYLGAFLLPLLLLITVYRWRRRERWLVLSAAGVLIVCMAPPFLLSAWKAVPFMDRIRHLFYFYTQYWQLLLTLLAAAGMDILLQRAYDRATRRRFLLVIAGFSILLLLVFIGYLSFSHLFPAEDRSLQANLRFALLALVASLVILQTLLFSTKQSRQLFVLVMIALALTDLSRYFWEVSRADKSFTETRWPVPSPLPQEVRAALRKPWAEPSLDNGFKANLYQNMPVPNLFWTDNVFMNHRYLLELRELPEDFQKRELQGPPVAFYTKAETLSPEQIREAVKRDPQGFINNQTLLLNDSAEAISQSAAGQGDAANFTYQWREWRYNDFALEVSAPQGGWLLIRQLDDPLWHLTVDGKGVRPMRANLVGMAVPLSEGNHYIRMEYRPLARSLYWWAALALEIALLSLLIIALLSKPAASGKLGAHANLS